ncbi:hypothetical protein [Lichenihabitans psoromatis]|uniref:hypothetical protein n=1 Tax=Lichenihabitans psoromatis TaxID=2528642 RepID=UPI001036AF3A|nr:hypothetical protein [Lichenihabitans psoromatis]
MRRVWMIEHASSPASAPKLLAEDHDEVLFWTVDATDALRFTDKHLAERFAMHRMTVPVCIVDRLEG